MAGAVSRGSVQTMNTMFFKPVIRSKAYHRKSSTDTVAETVKMEAEEANYYKSQKRQLMNEGELRGGSGYNCSSSSSSSSWVPHEKTGIYCPKGQEKVIDNVPSGAARDFTINWFNSNN